MKPALALSALLALTPAAHALPDKAFDEAAREVKVERTTSAGSVAHKIIDVDPRLWVEVEAPDNKTRTAVSNAGVSIEEVLAGKASGFALPAAVEALRKTGLKFKALPLKSRFHPEDFPKEDAAFHNYAERSAELSALAAQGAGLASLFSIGKSLQGRDLLALRLNSAASGNEASTRPGIVFMGNHHAREHLSAEIPLLLAKYLINNREKPEIKTLLAGRDVFIIPMVNPDGVEYDVDGDRYHMHRKNMRQNPDGSAGVDLNRNYGFHWGEGGASTDPGSDTYRGPAPFSEPETQSVKAFIEAHGNLTVLLSFHTFSELILYPWGHTHAPIPDAPALAAYQAMARTMAAWNGYKPQPSSDLYIASGDTTDWAWGARGIFSFTFELTPKSMWSGGFYPGAAAIASTFQANLRPALYLIDMADNPRRAGAPQQAASRETTVTGGR